MLNNLGKIEEEMSHETNKQAEKEEREWNLESSLKSHLLITPKST